MQKPLITYSDFSKLDMRIGTIVACEAVEKSEKLLKLLVDLGDLGQRTILSGIKKYFDIEKLIGMQVLVLANLEPKKMMARLDSRPARLGLESQGMILMAVENNCELQIANCEIGKEKITLLIPQDKVENGTGVE